MRNWMRLAWVVIAAAGIAALAHAQGGPTVYGKTLLQTNAVPAEALARFAQLDATMRAKGQKPGLMNGGSEDWTAVALNAPSAGNPYRVVVRVSGTALADGDARSVWMAGWRDDGATRLVPITGTSKTAAKANDRLEFVGASAPVSFKEDRNRLPAISFLGTENLRIDQVQVEVWGGVGKSSFVERVWAWSPLLLGVVFFAAAWWLRRR